MKLVYSDLNLKFEFRENECQVLVVENPKTFSEIVGDFHRQMLGEEDKLVLSENDKVLLLEKNCDLIINPYDLEINNRRVLGKLYQEMKTSVYKGLQTI